MKKIKCLHILMMMKKIKCLHILNTIDDEEN